MPEDQARRWDLHDREHEAAERAHRREHIASEQALDVATKELNRRLDDLNQLRKEVVLDRSQFVSSDAYSAEHSALKAEVRSKNDTVIARVDALEKIIDRAEGSLNTWRGIAAFLGVTGIGAVIYAIVNSSPN